MNKEIDDLIANSYEARRRCFDNVLYFMKKSTKQVHPYYVNQCQYRQLEKHKQSLKLCYTSMVVVDECNDPNVTHRSNRFKREVIMKLNYYKNHFSLTEKKGALFDTSIHFAI